MAAALNAFMQISKAAGESKQGMSDAGDGNYQKWIEIQSWEWEVEAESSWTKGSGASVGKAVPGKMNWEHYWDRSSNTLLFYICSGMSFDTIKLEMCKSTGKEKPEAYLKVLMKEAFITKVNQSATEEGNVVQKVEMVFKHIEIDYKVQGEMAGSPGALGNGPRFSWTIPEAKARQ